MSYFVKEKLQNATSQVIVIKKHTILLVDDDEANLQSLSELLQKEYNVLTANGGLQALEILQNRSNLDQIHLILCDQRMPHMTGVEFLKQTLSMVPDAIRVILSGFTDVEVLIKGINEGQIYKFMTKPFEPEELSLTVQRALETYELQQKNRCLVEELRLLNADLEKKVLERTIELEEAYQKIKRQQDVLNQELDLAKQTQLNLLPQSLPQIPNANIAYKYAPIIQVGGDLYNVFHIQDEYYGIMIADVIGHGPSAALISVLVSSIFAKASQHNISTQSVLEKVNEELEKRLTDGKFVSMVYCIYNNVTRELTYTSAGHPPCFLLRPHTDELIILQNKSYLAGIFSMGKSQFDENQIQLLAGDKLVLYTDAIIELPIRPKGQMGFNRFQSFLKKQMSFSIQQLVDHTYQFGLEQSANQRFQDDFTMIGLEVF